MRCAPGHGVAPGSRRRSPCSETARAPLALAALALVVPAVALAFDNTEPYAAKQWYLEQDNAWSLLADDAAARAGQGRGRSTRASTATHPELEGRVVAAKSFVGGSPYKDEQGHGTFVAGEIAANPTNAIGMAGLAFNAQLIDREGRRGRRDGLARPREVAAIRWAVDQGARVINLSLGGVRDPLNPTLDTYSPLEQAAVEYAYSKGVVVVAAVGNGPQSPSTPWRFAHYPSALPHVIGVSAVRQDGSVPAYSNRDAVYIDLAAPGDDIFSTIPTDLVETRRGLRRPPVLGLRVVRVSRRDRHVVRGAAGVRRRRAAPRPEPEAASRPGRVAARAERRRRERGHRLRAVPARAATPTAAGARSTCWVR